YLGRWLLEPTREGSLRALRPIFMTRFPSSLSLPPLNKPDRRPTPSGRRRWALAVLLGLSGALGSIASGQSPLAGTAPLTGDQDRSGAMRAGIGRYVDRETVASAARRAARWQRDLASPAAYEASVSAQRERLRAIVGAIDERRPQSQPEYLHPVGQEARIAGTAAFSVFAVRWPVLEGVWAEGLLLRPEGEVRARVVALPDADQTPEQIAGLT